MTTTTQQIYDSMPVASFLTSFEGKGNVRKTGPKGNVKDVVATAGKKGAKAAKAPAKALPLQAPSKEFDPAETGKHLPSIAAIIGMVLALQAKVNSEFWSTEWKSASQSMLAAVKLAPVIGTCIRSSYQAQSDEAKTQASMALEEGLIGIGASVLTAALGFKLAGLGEETNSALAGENETETADEGEEANSVNNDAAGDDNNAVARTAEDIDETQQVGNRMKRGAKTAQGKQASGMKKLFKALEKSFLAGQSIQGLANGITRLSVESPGQTKIAALKITQGDNDANSKVLEQYATYDNQNFQRNEDLRQGSQQLIDTVTNLVRSISEMTMQTARAIFPA